MRPHPHFGMAPREVIGFLLECGDEYIHVLNSKHFPGALNSTIGLSHYFSYEQRLRYSKIRSKTFTMAQPLKYAEIRRQFDIL